MSNSTDVLLTHHICESFLTNRNSHFTKLQSKTTSRTTTKYVFTHRCTTAVSHLSRKCPSLLRALWSENVGPFCLKQAESQKSWKPPPGLGILKSQKVAKRFYTTIAFQNGALQSHYRSHPKQTNKLPHELIQRCQQES